jgi:hypothetical protein
LRLRDIGRQADAFHVALDLRDEHQRRLRPFVVASEEYARLHERWQATRFENDELYGSEARRERTLLEAAARGELADEELEALIERNEASEKMRPPRKSRSRPDMPCGLISPYVSVFMGRRGGGIAITDSLRSKWRIQRRARFSG